MGLLDWSVGDVCFVVIVVTVNTVVGTETYYIGLDMRKHDSMVIGKACLTLVCSAIGTR